MKITDVPFAVLRFQYQLARVPLQLIEDRVVARMDAESPARLMYERSMGRLDLAVGGALGATDVQRRGAALVERSDELARAARLEEAAERATNEAESELKDAVDTAAVVREAAAAEKVEEATRARSEAAHQKVAAINDAEERAAEVAEQVDEVAAARKRGVETAKREEQDKIRAAESSAEAVADAKTKDAAKKRADAAAKRAQAGRVDEIADAAKQKRKSDG